MYYQYYYNFFVENPSERKDFNLLLQKYNVPNNPKEYELFPVVSYEFFLSEKMPNVLEFNKDLISLIKRLNIADDFEPDPRLFFEKKDYDSSPFFVLRATGNTQKAFLESKGGKQEKVYMCDECGVYYNKLLSPLVVDTAKIKKRKMVNVNQEHWVITESFAEMLYKWGITGYSLEEVISKSSMKDNEIVYRLIPTTTMPPWNEKMKFFNRHPSDPCTKCQLRNWVPLPYHYDADVINLETDFASTNEWVISGDLAYKPLLVSAKFRELLIENKITREVINAADSNYRSNDWLFEPVFIS